VAARLSIVDFTMLSEVRHDQIGLRWRRNTSGHERGLAAADRRLQLSKRSPPVARLEP
jgi:hypothetical protein